MRGERIAALNLGLETFRKELANDALAARRVEVAIVTFDSRVRTVQNFVTADNFYPPALQASGDTHMAGGIVRALDLIRARKEVYRLNRVNYYRPWVFMITDGHPEGEAEEAVKRASQRLRTDEQSKRVAFFAVAVEGADTDRLSQIVLRPPMELEGLHFNELFTWLSASMQAVSSSQPGDKVALPPIGWLKRIKLFITENEDMIKAGIRIGKVIVGLPSL
jgi:uncharacterized protein YegL